ncbi:MAG: 1,4-dihydroxy-2-naphthoate octaprenyltransferase [Cyclobacteriaceae bacterium]|jgi:1,4-dihydroxy-2-naphthoate octaprenyltransferase
MIGLFALLFVIKSFTMNETIIFFTLVISVGCLIGAFKISWMQDDIRDDIKDIKDKINSL